MPRTTKAASPAKRTRPAPKPKSPPKPTVAAFFDLDRTLVADSSALLLTGALGEMGLASSRERAVAGLARSFYRTVGETWIGMQITRRGIGRVSGWAVEDLREAARRGLELLDRAVYDEARHLIERHQAAGHLVCIATSTGRDFVEPLAERLGVDHLIASEYESEDGRYTGNLIGRWLWGPDKADAIKAFAAERGLDLAESFAYSDSYYDRHLFELVGNPRPVNPDVLLRALSARKGWPVLDFKRSGGGAVRGGGIGGAVLPPRSLPDVLDLLLPLSNVPFLLPLDVHVEGLENIPQDGGVIVAANHRSFLDSVVLAWVAARRGRKLRYLGKKEMFDIPVAGQVMRALGQIRVDRGSGDSRPLDEAFAALAAGDAIGIFPQGTIPRGARFYNPDLRPRSGVARLAASSGVPVVPVALWDTEKVWPRSHRVPKIASLATRARVHLRVGEPFVPQPADADDSMAMRKRAREIMDRITALLPDDVRTPPPPTEEQIKLATPAGKQA